MYSTRNLWPAPGRSSSQFLAGTCSTVCCSTRNLWPAPRQEQQPVSGQNMQFEGVGIYDW
eukprot:3022105-Alexandrium_andersonii.AAC.1